jgi:hypothetical protein
MDRRGNEDRVCVAVATAAVGSWPVEAGEPDARPRLSRWQMAAFLSTRKRPEVEADAACTARIRSRRGYLAVAGKRRIPFWVGPMAPGRVFNDGFTAGLRSPDSAVGIHRRLRQRSADRRRKNAGRIARRSRRGIRGTIGSALHASGFVVEKFAATKIDRLTNDDVWYVTLVTGR